MLKTDTTKLKLKKTYQKILHICPAYDDSFVFLGIKGLKQDCLTHVDRTGKILKEITFN